MGKKVKKGPKDFSKNFSNFFANSRQQNFKSRGSSGFLAPPLPHPTPPLPSPSPLSVSKICLKGWVFWHGMGLSRCGHRRQPKAECTEGPYIFSWLVTISNSVNEFFVAV
jgi:hypothetical protein